MKNILLSFLIIFHSILCAQPFIYVANSISNQVDSYNMATGELKTILDMLDNPYDIAVSPNNETIYISDPGSEKIISIEGGIISDLITGVGALDIELNGDGTKLYFTTNNDLVVEYDLINNEEYIIYDGGFVTLRGLAVDEAAELLFVADIFSDNILQIDIITGDTEIILTDIGEVWDIELDSINQLLFFTNRSEENIQQCDYDGNDFTTILDDIGKPRGLDIYNNQIYWATNKFGPGNPDKLQRADLDGSNLETIVEYSPFDNFSPFGLEVGDNLITESKEIIKENKFSVFPNPSADFITIGYEAQNNCIIQIIDTEGKILFEKNNQHWPLNLDLATFAAGNYYLQLLDGHKLIGTQKISIVK